MSVETGSTIWSRPDLTRTVAADLDAIFAEVRPQACGPARARSLTLVGGHGRAQPRRLPVAALGAIAAAALIGVAAGTFVPSSAALAPSPTSQPVAPYSPQPTQIATIAPSPAPSPAPVEAPPQRAIRAPGPQVEALQHRDRPRVTKASAKACARARCSRSEVMDADYRLRNAYFRAVKAGVPRPVLVSYRDRWARLRVKARHEPQQLVTGYRTLASGLTREARRS